MRIGPWVKDQLITFDLGYFKYQLFARIDENDGYFISRLKDNADPTIVAVYLYPDQPPVQVTARSLQDELKRLNRPEIDLQVEVNFKRRSYGGSQSRDHKKFRVVGMKDESTGEYHLYITNVPPDMLSTSEIAETYRYRWEIELAFKELKSYYHFDDLDTGNEHIVMSLVYAALITSVVAHAVQDAITMSLPASRRRVPSRRFASVFATAALSLLELIGRALGVDSDRVDRAINLMRTEGVDPNV